MYFPSILAVYNPFTNKLEVKDLVYITALIIIALSAIPVIILVLNSIYFTAPCSYSVQKLK